LRIHRLVRSISWKYALGEVSLIVIGILIALFINDWAIEREDRKFEAEYLQRIGDELRNDRVVLESIIRGANDGRLWAEYLSEFYDGRVAEPDQQRLVVANYKFGLDPIDLVFDMSTFNDLVSTGRLNLISDPEVRQAIQRAYAGLQRLAPAREPYRAEYRSAVSGLMPRSMTAQIRAACPEYSAYSACSNLDLDDDAVRLIVEHMDTREALIAFHIRDRGLGAVMGIGQEILEVLDETLALLER